MFKVTFKNSPKCPFKKVERFNDGKCTTVTLTGYMQCPTEFFISLNKSISDWIMHHPSVDTTNIITINSICLKTQGKTLRADGDEDNPILAERIAESRAKIKIYKFVYTLLKKIFSSQCKALFGISDFYPVHVSTGTVYEALVKYRRLLITERQHLTKLIKEA